MLLRFRRLADAPPPERELLDVQADGTATAWRSNGGVIGRFAGPVPDPEGLRTAVKGVDGVAPPPDPDLPADAAVEVLEIGDRRARFASRVPVDGPWGPLVGACRSLLDAMTGSPLAAIGATLERDGTLRLEARGPEPLPVELASLEATVTLWQNGREAAAGRVVGGELDRVEAGPGWSVELKPPAMEIEGGGTLAGVATFVADDEGIYVPVALTASVDLPS
jgi:hypothetical protein